MKQKFRAWDGERLRKVNTIGWVDEIVDFVTTPRYSGPAEDFILMQYTGLKDKNGVEIFEGDWIRVETQEKDNGEFPIGYVVRANDKPEMFIALPEQLKETGERQYHLENLYKHYSDEFEIIGNIYQNKDLI